MNTYTVSMKEILFGLTERMFEDMFYRLVEEKLISCLECYPEYEFKLGLKGNMWAYAKAHGVEEQWKEVVKNFQQNGIIPSDEENYTFENLTSDIRARYADAECWWRENSQTIIAKARAEQTLQKLVEEEKLPAIVDIMLSKCFRKEMVLPDYVAATTIVLKKWWEHKDAPRSELITFERDCYELHLASRSQKSAEKYFGIKRCLPCSLALALIQDIRQGINVYDPSKEQLRNSRVMYIAAEYGGNHKYKDDL